MEGAPSSLEGDQSKLVEHSRAIDCPVSVLQNLRGSVLGRFNSSPHGGGEISGVLFGTRNGDEVRITAFCPSASEGDLQQSEALTETQRAISAVISAARDQKELDGLEPVGWFRAHPRCEIGLTERDLEIANTLFPQPWQLVMVMRPGNSAVTRVCFYFRDREGPWTADCAVREFTLPPEELEKGPEFREAPAQAENPAPAELEFPEIRSALLAPPEWRRRPRFPLVLAIIAGAAFVAGGAYYYWFVRAQPLGLSVRGTDSATQIRVAWDTTARPVQNAKAAYVEFIEGGQHDRVDLDTEQLQIGYVNHQRQSNQVKVRLVVMAGGSTPNEEVAEFVAPPGSPPVAAPEEVARENTEAAPEQTPELVVPVPVDTGEAAPERPKFQPPRPRPARSTMMEEAPALPVPTQVNRSVASAPVATPPAHVEPPPEKPVQRPAPVSSTTPAASTPSQSASRPAAASHAPVAPSVGRMIWIGRLPKNQPLTISGKNSSTGTLIGELPGRPVKFSVSPGDLTSDGIVLYSSNMQYANSVVEPPGALNGWNKTVYTWNPKFANDVTVSEGPAAQNGWSHMVLRFRNPKISVIVIDWSAVN